MVSENNEHEASPGIERKERKPVARMIPLLSRRSIIVLVVGLVVGTALGIGYWLMSPSLTPPATEEGSGGLAAAMGQQHTGPYECRVNIQVVNPGSSYVSLKDLQRRGEYYAARANSFPFLEFLGQELAEQAPQFSHTVDELDQMIRVRYDWNDELPSFEIKVTGTSDQEALFLVTFIPQVFQDYMAAEESKKRLQECEDSLEEVENVKIALAEAQQELNTLTLQGAANDRNTDPVYVALSAKIKSLELKLDEQTAELAMLISDGSASDESSTRLQEEEKALLEEVESIRMAILQAEQELTDLTLERAANDISNDPDYLVLKAKIESLKLELEPHTAELATLIAEGSTGFKYADILVIIGRIKTALTEANDELFAMEAQASLDSVPLDLAYQIGEAKVESLKGHLAYLTERLSSSSAGTTGRQDYVDTQAAVERTGAALAEAYQELSILEAQTDAGHLAQNLDYQIAKTKVESLRGHLAYLTETLVCSSTEDVGVSETMDYLYVGNPSIPVPVLPERMRARNALMMGAVIGIGGAFVALNFKWLAKGISSLGTGAPEEDEEGEV